jgi:type II secretory pathway component PulF
MADEKPDIIIARIDERLGNLIKSNEKEHKEIIEVAKELCVHVNDENRKMDTRIKSLEDTRTQNEAMKKGELRVYKYATAILAIAVAVVTILAHFIPL